MNLLDLKQGKKIYLIGLTGNIACGKSTVLKFLREHGAYTIDADNIVHKIMEPGGSAYTPIIEAFGSEILAEIEDSASPLIDRRKLGAIVFANSDRLRQLEQITHPLVRLDMLQQIANTSAQVVVLDAIKLLENNLDQACDIVWVVTCTPEVQLERLMHRNNFSREEALLRIEAQNSQSEKIARANVVIDNTGNRANTKQQVEAAWNSISFS